MNRNLFLLQQGGSTIPGSATPEPCILEIALDGSFNPLILCNSEASDDYITSTYPLELELDGLDNNGNGPRDEVKTPKRNRASSNATYESFSADITFDLDNGVGSIPYQFHSSGPILVLLYVQDTSPRGIFSHEGEKDLTMADFPLLEGIANNGVFDDFVRFRVPGFYV